jgi:FAD:protein FMN transferase
VTGRLRRTEMIMGTAISLDLIDPAGTLDLAALADRTFAWFTEVDRRFSTYRDDSEVSRMGAGGLALVDASPDLRHVLDECERLRSATDGYFDAFATGRFDPSGYVKGWSVQVASDRLRAVGAVRHCVNAGGDIRLRGDGPRGPWRIGIRHPWRPDKVAWVVTGDDLAIATSGTYERGGHVIDPFRGVPAQDLLSVTITGADLGTADAYATAAVAMGERALRWLPARLDYPSAVVTRDARAFVSDAFPLALEDFENRAP